MVTFEGFLDVLGGCGGVLVHFWDAIRTLWDVFGRLGSFGMLWNVLGDFWNVLGSFRMFCDCLGCFWRFLNVLECF